MGLTDRLSDMDCQLHESAPEERSTKAEVVGLWAIADCARDDSEAAASVLVGARDKQAEAVNNLDAGRKRTEAQAKEVAERTAKRARIEAKLEHLQEALSAAERLSAGDAATE